MATGAQAGAAKGPWRWWRMAAVLVAWLVAALTLGASGFVAAAPGFLLPVLVLAPVAALVLAFRARGAFRDWALGIDLRVPILWQVVRAPIGAAFLVLHGRGELPGPFAIHAGWGDLAAGLLALPAAHAARIHTRAASRFVGWWNGLALIDILIVVASAQLVMLSGGRLDVLRRLPGSLLPTFVVPLVVAGHLLVLARRRRAHLDAHRRAGDRRE